MNKLPQVPATALLFLMTLALAAGALNALRIWWIEFSLVLITGFVLFAQEAISKYFEHPAPDRWIQYMVLMTAISYAILFYFSIRWKNEMAGSELFGGFILFLRKLLKEAMNGYHTDTATITTSTESTQPKGTTNV